MLGLSRFRSALLVGLLMSGCDGIESDAQLDRVPDVTELSERHACADLIVVAADAEGHEGLFLTIEDGLVDQVLASGDPLVAHYDIDDDRIELRWVSGHNVYAGHCGLDNGEPWQVDAVEQAVAGGIEVELIREGDAVMINVELRDVVLAPWGENAGQSKRGRARTLPPLILDDLELDR